MESLSSNNSLRFLDVKGRPNRSSLSAPDSDKAQFPGPDANPKRAEQPVEAEDVSEKPQAPLEPKSDGSEQAESEQAEWRGVDRQESNNAASSTDTHEGEDRGLNLSRGTQEADPEAVPTGAFGEIPAEKAVPIQFDLQAAGPQLQGDGAMTEPVVPLVQVEEAPTAILSQTDQVMPGSIVAQVASGAATAQVAVPKNSAQQTQATTAQQGPNPVVAQGQQTQEAPTGGFEQGQDFGQGEGEVPFGELDTQLKAHVGPSIESVIQDARIESIALDSRPATQAKPVQSVQAVAQTLTTLPGMSAEPGEAILSQVQARIQPSMNRAVLRLSPASLGRVGIQIIVDGGEVRADMRVESAESLQALQKYVPELKAMFAQADLELSELNLQLDSEGSGFEWEEETSADEQTWGSRTAAQENKSEASKEAKPTRLSPLEGGLDLIA
ncbi:MAG: flagellar hook-length control protein FliK [bacterium]|nr:flagellar hook-length control protein FliK [bacterium]